jgi:hypothetical protein
MVLERAEDDPALSKGILEAVKASVAALLSRHRSREGV